LPYDEFWRVKNTWAGIILVPAMPKRPSPTGIRASAITDSILRLSSPKDVLEYGNGPTSHELPHGYPVHQKNHLSYLQIHA
ncbi:MAG TPA: hypothetical protein PK272_09595, partial [Methanoregulaceae archaeon]|nr:hypothetical protein [Methanoregulaceae archaeon]